MKVVCRFITTQVRSNLEGKEEREKGRKKEERKKGRKKEERKGERRKGGRGGRPTHERNHHRLLTPIPRVYARQILANEDEVRHAKPTLRQQHHHIHRHLALTPINP